MKILLIHNYYRFRGGEDRYMDILASTLDQKGHYVSKFLADSQDINKFTIWQKIKIPLRLISSPALNRTLENCINEFQPDVAILHNLSPLLSLSLLKVLKKKGIPILKRLENYKFLCLNGLFLRNNFDICDVCSKGNYMPGIWHRCYQRSFLNSLGLAVSEWIHRKRQSVCMQVDMFLSPSQFVKAKFVEAGFPADRITVFPNFLDFHPLVFPVQPEGYAVYVGRLSKEKGLFTLLKAFQDLQNIPLYILGDGPLAEGLKEFTRSRNITNVIFHGFVDGEAKQEIMKKALFLVFPSECYESFGYSIIESYACGVPVVAADLGGTRELVKEGETGTLFEARNPDSLRRQINRLLINDALTTKMRYLVLSNAKKYYTREIGYINIMQSLDLLVQKRSRQ